MTAAVANDFRFCREVTRRSATNFYFAFRLLPPARRDALCALYAFCRAVDDAADEGDPQEAPRLLTQWRDELNRCYLGAPLHPVTIALARSLDRFPIPRSALSAILDGVEMDLVRRSYATFEELRGYCERVASAVGLAAIEIFGYRNPATRGYAIDLGIALQLTNVLRDVSEDAARGRVYLPQEDLDRFGYPASDLRLGVYNRRFAELMLFECERARAFYRAAESQLTPEDAPSLRPAEAMRRTYAEILARIVAEDGFVFGRRVRLSGARKLALAASLWLGSLRP